MKCGSRSGHRGCTGGTDGPGLRGIGAQHADRDYVDSAGGSYVDLALNLCSQTINTMTLGGLALAVGMLVDDATVEVENIHRNHTPGKPLITAILEGASQIATPTLVGPVNR